jgi:hypothetical protein
MASGNITRTPDYTLTSTEDITNEKINRVGGGTFRVDEGSITDRELSIALQGGFGNVASLRGNTTQTFTDGEAVTCRGYFTDGADDFGPPVFYDSSDSTTADDGLSCFVDGNGARFKRVFSGPVNVKWAGARGDDSNNDTTAIQTCLNLGTSVYMPTGVYQTTSEVYLIHGSKLIGDGNYSGVASTFETQGNTTIKYVGSGGTDSCVVRVSDEVVGTEPTTSATRDMQNTGVSNITIDGNNLADIGIYLIRAVSNNNYNYITAIRCKEHGIYVAVSWNGVVLNWMAYKNEKAGITIAKDIWGWSNTTVDQTSFISLFGYYNGYDDTSDLWTNNFSDANPDRDYGIGYWGGRGNVFINAQASQNGGPGIYLEPNFRPTVFQGGYVENNGKSSNTSYHAALVTDGAITALDATLTSASNPFTSTMVGKRIKVAGAGSGGSDLETTIASYTSAGEVELSYGASTTVSGVNVSLTNDWDIWFEGAAGGISWDVTFDSMHQGGLGAIRLTGTEPSRIEQGVLFRRMGQMNEVNSDWGSYRLIDCDRVIDLSGTAPTPFVESVNGDVNLLPVAAGYFNATGASIADEWSEGAITSIAYTGVGIYTVTLSETMTSAGYAVLATTDDNRIVSILSRTTTTFVIHNRTNAGTLTDGNARISFQVHGRYV